MPRLYPSWIEIPVDDFDRAIAFYRAVFDLAEIPIYDEPPMRIALLLASEKDVRSPGVSLVASPTHRPGTSGAQINFHVDTHAALNIALKQVQVHGGMIDDDVVDMGDGVRYITVLDSEGNRIALSSYEPLVEETE
jgi:predicted enzyme related to lactoylglutathione lyase